MIISLAEQIRASWDRCDAGSRPGVSDGDISTFETAYDVSLPSSVAAFYRTVNGMVGDKELFSAWPLAEVAPVPVSVAPFCGIPDYSRIVDTLPDAADYFAFGDCMMWLQVLAVRLRPAGAGTQVVWIQGHTHVVVASSFDMLWERYLEDPMGVLYPP